MKTFTALITYILTSSKIVLIAALLHISRGNFISFRERFNGLDRYRLINFYVCNNIFFIDNDISLFITRPNWGEKLWMIEKSSIVLSCCSRGFVVSMSMTNSTWSLFATYCLAISKATIPPNDQPARQYGPLGLINFDFEYSSLPYLLLWYMHNPISEIWIKTI